MGGGLFKDTRSCRGLLKERALEAFVPDLSESCRLFVILGRGEPLSQQADADENNQRDEGQNPRKSVKAKAASMPDRTHAPNRRAGAGPSNAASGLDNRARSQKANATDNILYDPTDIGI